MFVMLNDSVDEWAQDRLVHNLVMNLVMSRRLGCGGGGTVGVGVLVVSLGNRDEFLEVLVLFGKPGIEELAEALALVSVIRDGMCKECITIWECGHGGI